ncbi:hypothetical protein PoB_002658300 [Plakobranchus ocellatus]|uniref:Uncharacterized protein n=1 Tax=Plakobranchus ocellatus TaxID=259542 RepID=A0AAV4A037_9GAST|nr:hypothetical protein PoB_002658300 [Plakobranchus ocellatus]
MYFVGWPRPPTPGHPRTQLVPTRQGLNKRFRSRHACTDLIGYPVNQRSRFADQLQIRKRNPDVRMLESATVTRHGYRQPSAPLSICMNIDLHDGTL